MKKFGSEELIFTKIKSEKKEKKKTVKPFESYCVKALNESF